LCSTNAIAEKKSCMTILTNSDINEALGISSLCNDLSIDLSAQKANSQPRPKTEAEIMIFGKNKIPLL